MCQFSDVLNSEDRPHPLDFNPDKHKILNSELKHLYTAITRARVNVWIYDEDIETRKPMFEYLKARSLVNCMAAQQGNHSANIHYICSIQITVYCVRTKLICNLLRV